MTRSKFDAVLGQRKMAPSEPVISQTVETPTRRGRPTGKRTHPDYQQVTVYLPRALYDQIKIALIQDGRKEFSQMVEEQLVRWLNER